MAGFVALPLLFAPLIPFSRTPTSTFWMRLRPSYRATRPCRPPLGVGGALLGEALPRLHLCPWDKGQLSHSCALRFRCISSLLRAIVTTRADLLYPAKTNSLDRSRPSDQASVARLSSRLCCNPLMANGLAARISPQERT
jgi:hypothetical protein